MDAAGLRVDEVGVGFEVRAELFLEFAVIEEGLCRRMVHLKESPHLRVGEFYPQQTKGVGDLLWAVEV